MNKLNKSKRMVRISLISLLLLFIFNIGLVAAVDFDESCNEDNGDVCYETEVGIPGFPTGKIKVTSSTLGLYIQVLYEYLLYAAGVLAVIVIMVGGVQWITAGGNQSKIGEAKERVTSAIIGLGLALGSYLILFTINTDLVKIHDLNLEDINAITINGNSKCDFDNGWQQPIDEMVNFYCPGGYDKEETYNDGIYCYRCLDENGNIPCTDNYEIVNFYQDCKSSRFYKIPSNKYCCYVAPKIEPDKDCEGKDQWASCSKNGQPGYCDSNLQCSLCKRYGDYCEDERQCLGDYSGVEKCGDTQVGLSCKKIGSQPNKTCRGNDAIE